MKDEKLFRRNVLIAAHQAWGGLLHHERDYVVKKVEPRDTFDQLLYKMKKLFTNDRDPQNTLKIVRANDTTRPWFQSGNKHKKVYVRLEAFVLPLQPDEKLDVPHVYIKGEEKPVPVVYISAYVQGKHFYDDQAPHECPQFTAAVREKFGRVNGHITGWKPTQAFDKGWLLKYYKKLHKMDKLDDILKDFIDLDATAGSFGDNHWYSEVADLAGA